MKILHVVPTYMPAYRYGGPIQSVHALNKYLVRAGAEVTVYTTVIDGSGDLDVPRSASSDLKPVDRDGVKVCYFKPGRPRSWFYSPDMSRALKEHTHDFDVIHITSVFLAASTLGARAARRSGIPYMISPRGSLMAAPLAKKSPLKKRLYLDLVERRNLESADAIHFTTELEKSEYVELDYRLRQAFVIPNGLDLEALPPGDPEAFRKKSGISKEKKTVLFLGRLSWKKGLDTLIPAFGLLAREMPEAVLVLAGGDDENYKATVQKLIAAAGIRQRIIFTGALEGPERTAAYRAAEVFALPSYSENFGMTVLEAMHFGVPVVVTEEVALSSIVREAGAGIVIKKDAAALAKAMMELLKDPAVSRAMGERGNSVVAKGFSYDKVAQDFLKAYKELISSSHDQ